eukprot:GILK01011814.1.p1 GENE.GILK01011814.1~~GILK01011814.1.p1  ORF type:complete len:144 (+),score=17.32 GILK01011814.1:124-555(+)
MKDDHTAESLEEGDLKAELGNPVKKQDAWTKGKLIGALFCVLVVAAVIAVPIYMDKRYLTKGCCCVKYAAGVCDDCSHGALAGTPFMSNATITYDSSGNAQCQRNMQGCCQASLITQGDCSKDVWWQATDMSQCPYLWGDMSS